MSTRFEEAVRVLKLELASATSRKLGRALTAKELQALESIESLMMLESWCRLMEAPGTTAERAEQELVAFAAPRG